MSLIENNKTASLKIKTRPKDYVFDGDWYQLKPTIMDIS